MGVVYKARDPLIDRIVAIKTIQVESDESSENLQARLTMEARSAGRLHHPNIVTIFDFGRDGDLTYLAMEYVEGRNLASVISKRLPVPLSRKLEMIIQLCNALTYAHEVGVTHRDIKPANICLTSKEVPKLLDFGLARFDETRLTRSGFMSGTVAYMSPERMRGESGTSDDVFAMTVVAYEFLTYSNCFPGKNYGDIIAKILSDKFPAPPSQVATLPVELDAIFAKALTRDPKLRYPSAAALAKELDRFRLSPELAAFSVHEEQPAAGATALMTPSSGDYAYSAPEVAELVGDNPNPPVPLEQGTDMFDAFHFGRTSPSTAGPAAAAAAPAPADEDSATAFHQPPPLKITALATPVRTGGTPPKASPLAPPPASSPALAPVPPPVVPRPVADPVEEIQERTVVAPRPPRREDSGITLLSRITEKLKQKSDPSPADETTRETAGRRVVIEALPLALAIAAAPLLASVIGLAGYLAAYAVATVLWFRFLKRVRVARLGTVLILALVLRVVTLTNTSNVTRSGIPAIASQQAVSGTATIPQQPVAPLAYVLGVIAASLGGAVFWRGAILLGDLAAAWLLWDPERPGLALSWATFPFIVLGGFWRGHVELLVAALLLGAFLWARGEHEATGGIAFGVAAGLSPIAFATLPPVADVAVRVERTIVTMLIVLSLPWLLGGRSAVIQPLTSVAQSSVTLSVIGHELEDGIDSTGIVPSLRHVADNAMKRGGLQKATIERWRERVNARSLAILSMLIVAWIVLTTISKRSRDAESALGNCLGVFLIFAVNLNPAAWLLAVPMALLARQRGWILVAAFAPLLELVEHTGIIDYFVFALSLLAPAGILLWIRARNAIAEKTGRATQPAKA